MDIKKSIENIIFKYLGNSCQIFLFGSRAFGNSHKNSDYDVGIIDEKKIKYSTFIKIKRELAELPFLIDLVDFNSVDDPIFKSLALKKTIKWN